MNHEKILFYFSELYKEFEGKILKEKKETYLKLAHKYHPDKGGENEAMAGLNMAYEKALNTATEIHNEEEMTIEKDMMAKIQEIIHYQGITIEVMGTWLWVSGNTRQYKEEFKKLGFFYAFRKQVWYFRANKNKVYHNHGEAKTLDEIRQKYGSHYYKTHAQNLIYT